LSEKFPGDPEDLFLEDPPPGFDVAIVGLAGRFPGARNVEQFWRNLAAGVESVTFFTEEEISEFDIAPELLANADYVRANAVLEGIEEFDAAFFGFTPREAEITDPQHRLFLECAWEALEDAGYDPQTYVGTIGVYAGVDRDTYSFNLYSHPEILRSVGVFQSVLGTDKDYLATRASYKLDLTGPSVVIQSACSTSLVALHLANQALLAGDCDMALVGGVSVLLPQERGYLYTDGGIYSPDGHCRAFDARAGGTLGGNGVALVVLKRLEDALDDGDHIRAVVKGSAINNDGSGKVGYTAPSVEGQARVIEAAQAVAGVDPASISYVEAHGTGTKLGDPIEFEALHRVFRDPGRPPRSCGVGSVKTNVGHLGVAAGVAGLIKTTLALEHRELPPSLHFETPNPRLEIDQGPFYVNTELRPWPEGDGPRRAGVSSFGIGGTNAHAVLEEAPEPAASSPSRPWQLLVVSARSAPALETATRNLARHLEAHPEQDLADVAFTSQVGRRRFQHRRIAVCSSRGEALEILGGEGERGPLTRRREIKERQTAFLFPGQGAQYPGMGRGLYETERVFRQSFDRSAELLRGELRLDLREVVFADPDDPEAARRLAETALTQPALFAVEYALAELWRSWGIEPEAMIGHSLGEYVAACLAGVFSLEDALRLVAVRGRRMGELPAGGAMLSVTLAEDELAPLLVGGLELAAVNGPGHGVVSGPEEEIENLRAELAERGLEARRLRTSHAFHSAAMEPMLAGFAEDLSRVELREPQIPFLSNLTGGWIEPEEARDPDYWVRHLRQTVRFGAGLGELLGDSDLLLLEVGPGRTLSTLARQHESWERSIPVVGSIRHPGDKVDDGAFLLTSLGRLWMEGCEIDWRGFYADEERRRVPLPTYPFERQRYWLERRRIAGAAPAGEVSPGEREARELPDAADLEARESAPTSNRPELDTAYAAPRSALERRVVAVWEDLLGIDPIGIQDDFFELGGHSLLAAQMASRLREAAGVDIALRELFENPTPAGMAAAFETHTEPSRPRAETLGLPTLVPDPENRHEPFPLTDVQEAYWLGRSGEFELGNVATHNYLELDLGAVDVARFEHAWRRLIDRHDMLRAIVQPDGRQRILAEVPPYEVRVLELEDLPAEEAERELQALRHEMSHQVLPADRWPLFEVRASRLAPERIRLHISFDFLIGDAWSWEILLRELLGFYRDPEAELEPLEISYRDYVLAERAFEESAEFQRSRDYWHARLDSLPPAPELPLAKGLSEVRNPRFVRRRGRLAAGSWQRLKARAAQAGLTSSGVVLAAYAAVLATWCRKPHFTLNLTLFHRLGIHPQVNEVIGDFTSLVLLEVDLRRGVDFEARARAIQAQLWEDLDHRYLSGVRVMRELGRRGRGRGGRAMMPIVFTSTLNVNARQNEAENDGGGEGGDEGGGGFGVSQTPQVYLDHQVGERGGSLVFNWDVVAELFPEGMLEAMYGAYLELLERLANDESAWSERRAPLVPEEQLLARSELNATGEPLSGQRLDTLFTRQAERSAESVALVVPEGFFTYGELERRSRELARRLVELGARREHLVAVVLPKGWRQVVAALGVVRSGAAYLPIDPTLPPERRRELLERGRAELAVTSAELAAELDWPGAVRPVEVGEKASADAPPLDVETLGDQLAYVIFTSGSTGRPKGVMIEHRGAVNTLVDVNRRFEICADDRVLALSSLSFDLSVYDLFGLFAAGGAMVLPEPGALREPGRWLELLERERVTIWNTVPALMTMLVDHVGESKVARSALRRVLLSGDWIPLTLPERIRGAFEGARVVSLGGATEASIWSILHPIEEVDPAWPSIPYGRPMLNQSFEVLDAELDPRPVWATGELWIGGMGLARGYWREGAKTAAAFMPHPETGERLYRTGDLGRYLPGGEIEFLGREDFQVKIGGHRVELGEIEAVLERHGDVRAAVATAVGGERFDRRLAVYAVPAKGRELTAAEVQEHLRLHVPEYMVPGLVIFLEALPLSANGKVDRSALPAPEAHGAEADTGETPPRPPTEELVASVWCDVLGLESCGVERDFFELGGDSLLAVRVLARLREAFEVELGLRRFFDLPTVAGLASAVEEGARVETRPPPEPVPRESRMPLSITQERLWFLEQLQGGGSAYNMPAAVRLVGDLGLAELAGALREIVRRHETLRTTFVEVDGGPWAVIAETLEMDLARADLEALESSAREGEALRLLQRVALEGFDLEAGPLLRALVVELEPAEHFLILSMHHVVSDAWSMQILVREIAACYDALRQGRSPRLPELPIQYADYAVWQRRWLHEGVRGEEREGQMAYWRERLEGAPKVLELPTDRPRPSFLRYRSAEWQTRLGRSETAKLHELARGAAATLFMTLLTALDVLIHRLTGESDFLIGTPVAGRERSETENLVGPFINTLVLRADLSGEPSFRELLARVRATALGAYAHQDVAFEQILAELQPERDASRTPLFQVLFNMPGGLERNRGSAGETSGELEIEPIRLPGVGAGLDLTLYAAERGGELELLWVYNAELFDAERIEELGAQYHLLLDAFVGDPDLGVDAPLLSTPRALELVPDPAAALPRESFPSVGQSFLERAAEGPEAPALEFENGVWSYGELAERALEIRGELARRGVEKGETVALYGESTPELVAALLGIFLAGGVLLSLDRRLPPARRALSLRRTGARLVIRAGGVEDEEPAAPDLEIEELRIPPGARFDPAAEPPAENRGDDPAYVFFTSGSTGEPKAVVGRASGLTHFIAWQRETWGVGPGDRVAQLTGLTFDAVLRDVFLSLTSGACLCLPPPGLAPERTLGWLAESGVSLLHTVPSLAASWLEGADSGEPTTALRAIFFSGEPLAGERVERWRRHLPPDAEVVNFYGATETTLIKCHHRVADPAPAGIQPVGRAMPGAQALILADGHRLCGLGESGEIVVRTPYASLGYLGDPEATARRFRPNPFGDDPEDLLYFTGDRGRFLLDGEIEILGRFDDQVKIRGVRIEPAEIRAELERQPEVAASAVVAHRGEGEPSLVAYWVPVPGAEVEAEALRRRLAERLPASLVPTYFIALGELPLTPSGKLDRRALPAPEDLLRPQGEVVAPRDTLELQLVRLWEELLETEPIGVRHDFFEIGGHSLLALRLMAHIRNRFGCDLPIGTLLAGPTIEHLAEIMRRRVPPAATPLVAIRESGGGEPLYVVHASGGEVLSYHTLARHLDRERPIYGLQARGAGDGLEPRESVEAMAEAYLEAILSEQPSERYLVAGWSSGGLVAYEMARRLRARGEEVAFVGLFDTFRPRPADSTLPTETEVLAEILRVSPGFADMEIDLDGGVEKPLEAFVERSWERGILPRDFSFEKARAYLEVYRASLIAARTYDPPVYDGRITLFRAGDRPGDAPESADPFLGWGDRVSGGVEVREIPGVGHADLFREPHVKRLARELEACLAGSAGAAPVAAEMEADLLVSEGGS